MTDDFAQKVPDAPGFALPDATEAWPSVTYVLKFPITLPDGRKLTEVRFEEPSWEVLEALEASGIGADAGGNASLTNAQARVVMAALAGISPDDLKRVKIKDITGMLEAAGPFLEAVMAGA